MLNLDPHDSLFNSAEISVQAFCRMNALLKIRCPAIAEINNNVL